MFVERVVAVELGPMYAITTWTVNWRVSTSSGPIPANSSLSLDLPQPCLYRFLVAIVGWLVPYTKCLSHNEFLWGPYRTYELIGKASLLVKFCLWFPYSGDGQVVGMEFLLSGIVGAWKWAHKVEHRATYGILFWVVHNGVKGKALTTWTWLRGEEYGQGQYPWKGVVEVTQPLVPSVTLEPPTAAGQRFHAGSPSATDTLSIIGSAGYTTQVIKQFA